MNEQKGALKLKGTHGDFTFVETIDGFIWKKKAKSLTKDQIMNDPKQLKLKHIIMEFGRAGNAVKLIRDAFESPLEFAKDRRLTSRLQKKLTEVLKAATTGGRGLRLVKDGALHLLEKFEMNINAGLYHTMPVQVDTAYDRVTGEVTLNVPSFIPAQILKRAANVTHYKIVCAAATLDFEGNVFENAIVQSASLPVQDTVTPALVLQPLLPAASPHPVIVMVGIMFAEVTNGFVYPEIGGEFNALCITKVDKP